MLLVPRGSQIGAYEVDENRSRASFTRFAPFVMLVPAISSSYGSAKTKQFTRSQWVNIVS